jgi:4'-phosphopantetheinyl transferase EntD
MGEVRRCVFLPEWLPGEVLSATSEPDARVEDLYPEEAALVARAVEVRRGEFATGRLLARALLTRLGCAAAPLLSRADRSPAWPDGVIGSITHTHGLCAAAVARSGGAVLGLGIDVERAAPLEEPTARHVLTGFERQSLGSLSAAERAQQAMIAFCVKEAIYKCLYPVGNVGLGFADVEVILPAATPAVEVRPGSQMLRRIPRGAQLECGFSLVGRFVRAAAVLRRHGTSQS